MPVCARTLPTTLAPDVVRLTAKQLPQLLAAGQRLDISLASRIIVFASSSGPIQFCPLTPTALRLLVVLLLGDGAVASYSHLLAGLACSEPQFQALLEAHSLEVAGFPDACAKQDQRLVQQALLGRRERSLKPLRGFLPQALSRTLQDRQFPWRVASRYGQGYRLYIPIERGPHSRLSVVPRHSSHQATTPTPGAQAALRSKSVEGAC